jgi:hypothetical protein
LAERLAALRPKHRLDHLVKERCTNKIVTNACLPYLSPTSTDLFIVWLIHHAASSACLRACACACAVGCLSLKSLGLHCHLCKQLTLTLSCLGRYPSFVDALRDLDDPLTLVHLFATLPAEEAHKIPAKAVATSRRLALEWQAWVVRTSALRRTFVSVKGFYFQADVMGQPVTWLVPHATSQVSWLASLLTNPLCMRSSAL